MGFVDRGARNDGRQRRALQKLGFDPAAALGFTGGDGITISPSGEFSVDILTNGGLEFSSGELAVNVDENFGLSLNSSGIRIDVLAAGGLSFSAGDLQIKLDPVADNLASLSSSGLNVQSPLTTKGDLFTWSTINDRLPVGSDGQILSAASGQTTGLLWIAAPTGTVTSVGLTMPTGFAVAGSPVTTSGTLAVTLSGMTSGSVFFTDGTSLLQNNVNFFWDNTANLNYLRLGSGTAGGEIRLLEGSGGGTNYAGFKANATLAGNTIYTLPTAFPASTQFLRSTSAGVMSFSAAITATGGSNVGDVQLRSSSTALTGSTQFNYVASTGTLFLQTPDDVSDLLQFKDSGGSVASYFNGEGKLFIHEVTLGNGPTDSIHGTYSGGTITNALGLVSDQFYFGPTVDSAGGTTGTTINFCYGRTPGTADSAAIDGAAKIATLPLDVKLTVAGNGVYIKEGTNATMGVATLVAGTVVVNTTKVTANSRIFLTVQSLGTVAVATPIAVTARTASTSFTITSSAITDTSVVAWWIVEPA